MSDTLTRIVAVALFIEELLRRRAPMATGRLAATEAAAEPVAGSVAAAAELRTNPEACASLRLAIKNVLFLTHGWSGGGGGARDRKTRFVRVRLFLSYTNAQQVREGSNQTRQYRKQWYTIEVRWRGHVLCVASMADLAAGSLTRPITSGTFMALRALQYCVVLLCVLDSSRISFCQSFVHHVRSCFTLVLNWSNVAHTEVLVSIVYYIAAIRVQQRHRQAF